MKIYRFSIIIIFLIFLFGLVRPVQAAVDYDADGYTDDQEIHNGYSPFNPAPVKITASDIDGDGLRDDQEIKFKTDPANPDTDGDGFKDGQEIDWAHDPLSTSTALLSRQIIIDRAAQKLSYLVDGQVWKEFTVSTGRASLPTPPGNFKIINKSLRAWSPAYGLWMPYWLGLGGEKIRGGSVGIHELPVWPSGYREGSDHLGRPVSHGCIRLGIGPAEYLFDRVSTGTPVVIK